MTDNNQNKLSVQLNSNVEPDCADSLQPDSERTVLMEQALVNRLVEEHHEMLYRFAFRLSGSRIDAEDLTQETYLVAQTRHEQLRKKSCARSWLCTILRNLFLKNLRKQQKVPTFLVEEPPAVEEPLADDSEISAEVLQMALQELPEEFRTPLILYYFDEMSYKQIASFLDVPIGTVMSRLARGKTHLRSRLSPLQAHIE